MTIPFRLRGHAFTIILILAAIVATLADVPIAGAHVTISPAVVRPNVYQAFVVEVPTEKTVPTITIRVEIPAGLRVSRFQPKPGWTRSVEKDEAGLIVAVTWTGGSIAPDEYEEFVFLARTPREPGPLVFKAYQTYEGGEVVGWTEGELDNFPAAVVQVSDEAPAEGIAQPPVSIEEPAVTPTSEATESPVVSATTAATAPATTAPPSTPTPAPNATVEAPVTLPTTALPAAGGVTPAEPGTDLALFVALAALVVSLVGTAVATVSLLRRRGTA